MRWTIEACFRRAKEEPDLDHREARSWHGWYRHITLCMAEAAFLSRLSAQLRQSAGRKENARRPAIRAA
jgi:SRSO17 transposase